MGLPQLRAGYFSHGYCVLQLLSLTPDETANTESLCDHLPQVPRLEGAEPGWCPACTTMPGTCSPLAVMSPGAAMAEIRLITKVMIVENKHKWLVLYGNIGSSYTCYTDEPSLHKAVGWLGVVC